jgi:hypothetical protein
MSTLAQSVINFEKASHSIHHQMQLESTDIVEFARHCEPINAATNENLERFVIKVNKMVPPIWFDAGNPNNGRPFHTFTVGQEHSRVIYVQVIKAYIKNWNDKDYERLGQMMKLAATSSEADEAYVTENDNGCFTFRAWWD